MEIYIIYLYEYNVISDNYKRLSFQSSLFAQAHFVEELVLDNLCHQAVYELNCGAAAVARCLGQFILGSLLIDISACKANCYYKIQMKKLKRTKCMYRDLKSFHFVPASQTSP